MTENNLPKNFFPTGPEALALSLLGTEEKQSLLESLSTGQGRLSNSAPSLYADPDLLGKVQESLFEGIRAGKTSVTVKVNYTDKLLPLLKGLHKLGYALKLEGLLPSSQAYRGYPLTLILTFDPKTVFVSQKPLPEALFYSYSLGGSGYAEYRGSYSSLPLPRDLDFYLTLFIFRQTVRSSKRRV